MCARESEAWAGECVCRRGGGLHAAYERAKCVGVTDDEHRLTALDERGAELLVPQGEHSAVAVGEALGRGAERV